jgi:heat shock protein HslJ
MKHGSLLAVLSIGVLTLLPLVAAGCGPAATAAPTSPAPTSSIQGIVWHWTSVTNQNTKETTTVPTPASYTIVFNPDGTLTGQADCNAFSGTYEQTSGLTIKIGTSTMAFCGEASLDQQYLTLLGDVVAGGPDGTGGLALENAGGEKRMLFEDGGPAPK